MHACVDLCMLRLTALARAHTLQVPLLCFIVFPTIIPHHYYTNH